MAYVFVIFGTLIAFNIGFVTAASEKKLVASSETGQVNVEVMNKATPALEDESN